MHHHLTDIPRPGTGGNGAIAPLALRPRDAAKALGISERTLWQLTKDGAIPCVRVGLGKRKSILYPVATLHEWLAREAKGGNK